MSSITLILTYISVIKSLSDSSILMSKPAKDVTVIIIDVQTKRNHAVLAGGGKEAENICHCQQ